MLLLHIQFMVQGIPQSPFQKEDPASISVRMLVIRLNLMSLTCVFKGSNMPTKVGLMLAHRSHFVRMRFLLLPMTHMGTSGI